jgi:light-regulated signal transduction histidine kinase (bacteriophytochrome)
MTSTVAVHLDLTSGDHEPIDIPPGILPHGAMLVIDCDTFEILQAAGDTPALLGASAEELPGRTLESLFRPREVGRLRNLCDRHVLRKPRHLLNIASRARKSPRLDASIHRSGGFLVLEFEDADAADGRSIDPLVCLMDMIEGLDTATSMQSFCHLAVERVRSASGYDRVMIYRFSDDDSGWVFVESREQWLDSFLDLHHPAADIPKHERALYLENCFRLITQVDYEPSPLTPLVNPRTHQPLDMTQAILRDVPPVHRDHLRKMGVDASMSMSIISEGKLWGLIACFHHSPRRMACQLRAVCELFGSMFSLQLEARERAETALERGRAQAQVRLLTEELGHRVTNTLANIQTLSVRSSRGADSLDGLTQSLDQRMSAMGNAHELLAKSRWEGVSIGDLVHGELDSHGNRVGGIIIGGPEVLLTPQATLALSLALHELRTNAARYGSLSHPDGRLTVQWRMTEAGGIYLSWQESGGPLVEPPTKRGFGSNLIEQALAIETGGHSTLKFDCAGATCDIVLPSSSIVRLLSEQTDTAGSEAHIEPVSAVDAS